MGMIDDCIERCEEYMKQVEEHGNYFGGVKLVDEVYGAMADIPDIKKGLRKFKMRIYTGNCSDDRYSDVDASNDVRILYGKLKHYRDEKEHELEIAKLNAAGRGANVVIKDIGNSSATAISKSTSTTVVSLSQIIDLIDSDDFLTDEKKAELQSMIANAKKEATKKDSSAFARIGAKVIEGLENATPAVVSGALGFLYSLASQHFMS